MKTQVIARAEAQEMSERFRTFWVYFFYIFIIGGGAVYHFIMAPK